LSQAIASMRLRLASCGWSASARGERRRRLVELLRVEVATPREYWRFGKSGSIAAACSKSSAARE
jgi:hypothetical protein